MVVLETERLRLRPVALGDLDDILEMQSHPDVARFVGTRPEDAVRRRLAELAHEWAERGHGLFTVLDRRDGRFLGRLGLHHWPEFGEVELGWMLRRDEWGHGYATEAGRACLDWGFAAVGPPYITAMIAPANAPSIAVAERLGMRPRRDDEVHDTPVVVYAATRTPDPAR